MRSCKTSPLTTRFNRHIENCALYRKFHKIPTRNPEEITFRNSLSALEQERHTHSRVPRRKVIANWGKKNRITYHSKTRLVPPKSEHVFKFSDADCSDSSFSRQPKIHQKRTETEHVDAFLPFVRLSHRFRFAASPNSSKRRRRRSRFCCWHCHSNDQLRRRRRDYATNVVRCTRFEYISWACYGQR